MKLAKGTKPTEIKMEDLPDQTSPTEISMTGDYIEIETDSVANQTYLKDPARGFSEI